jgi:IclR family transcriptional regulator, acetate operon repressor
MKATDRVVEVLCLFTAIRPERSTAEVAEGLGMAHSSAHELLNGLARTGLLRKRAPGRFRLGPMINSLVEVLASTDLVVEASRESVVEMAETYGETVHVIELMGSRLLSLTGQEGSSQVHVASAIVSANLPVHLVAPGRLLLSHLPAQQVERMVKEFGDETGPDGRKAYSEQFLAELADIRADNYACEAGHYLPDLATVAAPILNHANMCIAAFALFIPNGRYSNEPRAFRNITIRAAKKISSRLGWDPGDAATKQEPPQKLDRPPAYPMASAQ